MSALERICPQCGTTNSADRTHCVRCNTNLITLSARGQSSLPARLENPQAAVFVLGASALIARIGLNLLARAVLPRLVRGVSLKRTPPARKEPSSVEQPDYIVRGWRSWRIQRGEDRSSGSEQFEWRIKKRE